MDKSEPHRIGHVKQAVVFDLFHTLIDPEDFRPKEYRRASVVADILGLPQDEFRIFWDSTQTKRMLTAKPEMDYVKEFAAANGRTLPESKLSEADRALSYYQDLAILNPRVEVTVSLRSLKDRGYKLGLLSNTRESDVREWPHSPLTQFFDAVAFSHIIGVMKPDSGAYSAVLRALGISDSSECTYVGDGGSEELTGAKNVGFGQVIFMRRFVSRNGLRSEEELGEIATQGDLSVDSFEELCRVVD